MRFEFRNEEDGWFFHSGQDDSCLNIRVYSNGATDAHYATDPEWAEENIDEIHICDIDAFIVALERARSLRDTPSE